jgi:hypothetical protein
MTLLESYLDQLQTEKLDVNELISKANIVFQRSYKNYVSDCFAKEERDQYSNPYADMKCEDKAQLFAYQKIFKKMDRWLKHCEDQECINQVKAQKNKIQAKINYLQK